MYIETSSPRVQGDNARLVSDVILSTAGTSGRCLTFWYHMYGYHTGTLNVFIQTGNHLTNVWQRNGTQGNNWLQGKTTLVSQGHFKVSQWSRNYTRMKSHWRLHIALISHSWFHAYRCVFQVVIEAITGQGYQSDISIDDITLTPGACSYSSSKCTFEDSKVCGFTQDSSDDFNWIRNSGRTLSGNTGPSTDHTLKTSTGMKLSSV